MVVLVCIVLLLGKSAYERYQIERDMQTRREAAEAERAALEERREILQERIDYLTGERGVEEEVRQQFDVAKPGEQVIILTGEPPTSSTPAVAPEANAVPWYQFWRK
jgi:cell division protein FtsB